MASAAMLDFWVNMMLKCQTDVNIGILVVDLPPKISLCILLGALVQKLIFQDDSGSHLGFLGPNNLIVPAATLDLWVNMMF